MKRLLLSAISLILTASMLLCAGVLYAGAAEKAFNIYSNPDVSGTSQKFTTYMIDFRSDQSADATYWALANFGLFKSRETSKKYRNISGGGAYAGLQDGAYAKKWDGEYIRNPDGTLWNGKVGILSFWDMRYRDKEKGEVVMTATRVYPHGESTFGGEGEGTNCIQPYEWRDNSWYRMALHSWEDSETGTTFVGEWYMDVETGEWTLFAYFDTHLIGSCMEGGMGLFMENFSSYSKDDVRTFNTKNIYAQDFTDGSWKSLSTCTISYGDGGSADKVGGHDFGATDEYFWGMAGGVVENQKEYDKASTKQKTFTITQPDTPDFGTHKLSSLTADPTTKGLTVSWKAEQKSTPQLSYKLEVFGKDGEKIAEKAETRPQVTSVTLENVKETEFKCVLTTTDIFGAESSVSYESEGYGTPAIGDVVSSLPFGVPEFAAAAAATVTAEPGKF